MEPKIYHQTFFHDDNCPTIFSQKMSDCACKPEVEFKESSGTMETARKIVKDLEDLSRLKAKYN